ncbi:Methyl-accepting chemotaxis protein McpA [Sulfitobacter noctilucae]|uniref:methyl-accepting chemotaxis protein n=1 Tax=Sulfitobacter noctilucae TaxID=1342302 RepID=UPI0004681471|nr:methyl-accepting chemotaxis protein [Sulfitobacter noctilucae]KIN61166.1 Methyl-accepting chemotaxis protein McpA [Sulfitobacter noctilucae]
MPLFFSKVLHSLMLRLGVVLGALALMIAAVVAVSWIMFQSIETQMVTLSDTHLPKLRASADVVSATEHTRELLSDILVAEGYEAIAERAADKEEVVSEFKTALAGLPETRREKATTTLTQADAALSALLQAREEELRAGDAVDAFIEEAFANASEVSGLLEEATDTALFDMNLRGEDAIEAIDQTLSRLVDEDFNQFQSALSLRAEVNLLSGLALAFLESERGDLRSIQTDLATSALQRLEILIDQIKGQGALGQVHTIATETIGVFDSVFDGGLRSTSSADILAARLAIDQVLSPAIDDVYFNLIIGSDEAKETNSETLTTLLDVEVAGMRDKANLDSAVKFYFAFLLRTALSKNATELSLNQDELTAKANAVRSLAEGSAEAEKEKLETLLSFSSAETGMASKRSAAFAAQTARNDAAQRAAQAVGAIAIEAATLSSDALGQIEDSAIALSSGVQTAGNQISQIAIAAVVLLVFTPFLMWFLVNRPLNRVTAVTERLAGGDLSEIDGLSVNSGELGRLAGALFVFRARALETIKLQEEEKQREREAFEAAQAAEQAKQEEQERIATEKRKREETEREAVAKLAAKEEEQERLAEAERQDRMREQDLIVSTLAEGLARLSAGDLTYSIEREFPAAYEALRHDFNTAIATLSEVVSNLSSSVTNIEGSSAEISGSSMDLAKRTEANAATLADTVRTVGDLTSTVAETASGATSANDTVSELTKASRNNKLVMENANKAMKQVQESSSKISSIVSVIEGIAFQTNLLALNAGVEAARAGEAGQGFSVVASEVRILAQRCAESAAEISGVIGESVKIAVEGAALTQQANEAMTVIDSGVGGISQIMENIAVSAKDQSHKLNDVNAAIQEIDRSTQQNAAMFEETTAANTALSNEAQALSEIVATFRFQNSPSFADDYSEAKFDRAS